MDYVGISDNILLDLPWVLPLLRYIMMLGCIEQPSNEVLSDPGQKCGNGQSQVASSWAKVWPYTSEGFVPVAARSPATIEKHAAHATWSCLHDFYVLECFIPFYSHPKATSGFAWMWCLWSGGTGGAHWFRWYICIEGAEVQSLDPFGADLNHDLHYPKLLSMTWAPNILLNFVGVWNSQGAQQGLCDEVSSWDIWQGAGVNIWVNDKCIYRYI